MFGRAVTSPSKFVSTPAMIFSSVDFPEPFKPSTPIFAPGKKFSEIFLRIWRFGGTVLATRRRVYTYWAIGREVYSKCRSRSSVLVLPRKQILHCVQRGRMVVAAPDELRPRLCDPCGQSGHRHVPVRTRQLEDGARNDREAGPGGHAGNDRVIRLEFHDAIRQDLACTEPGLEPLPVRAARRKCNHGPISDVFRRTHLAEALRRDENELFDERRLDFETVGVERFRDESGFYLLLVHPGDQGAGRARDQLDLDVRIELMVAGQNGGQPARSGAFQRPDPQGSPGFLVAQRGFGLRGKSQQLLGEGEQQLALRGQRKPATDSQEELGSELLFELFDPGRNVRGHAVQLRRSLVDAALLDHGFEDLERGEIHILNKRTYYS